MNSTVKLGSRLLQIPGITAKVFSPDGLEIPVASNGQIGRVGHNNVMLTVMVDPGLYFIALQINDTDKSVGIIKDASNSHLGSRFERMVNIHTTSDVKRIRYPDFSQAIIRLVGVSKSGLVGMFNVAIVSQGGHFFVVQQQMFSEQAYGNGDVVNIPGVRGVKKWTSMVPFIERMVTDVRDQLDPLPNVNQYVVPTKPDQNSLDYNEGKVLWYSLREQFGCVQTRKGQARIHWSDIKTIRSDALKYLLPGEKIRFDLLSQAPRRKAGGRETGFELEVRIAEVIE